LAPSAFLVVAGAIVRWYAPFPSGAVERGNLVVVAVDCMAVAAGTAVVDQESVVDQEFVVDQVVAGDTSVVVEVVAVVAAAGTAAVESLANELSIPHVRAKPGFFQGPHCQAAAFVS